MTRKLPTLDELQPENKDYPSLFRGYSRSDRILKKLRLVMTPFLWLAFSVAVIFGAVMGLGKAILNLFLGRPLAALKTFLTSILLLIAAPIIGVISLIYPPLIKNLIRSALIPATKSPLFSNDKDGEIERANYEKQKNEVVESDCHDLPNKGLVDTHDIYCTTYETKKMILTFLGNAERYNSTDETQKEKYQLVADQLRSNLCIVNYPGYTTEKPSTIDDVVNVGISQVYALMREKNWLSKKDIEENICLQGRSMGGGVALQVALFFKQRYDLDLKVFIDRSFSSLDSTSSDYMTMSYSPMPKWYQRLLVKLAFTAMGGWNMNSAEAVKSLTPEKVRVVNLAFTEEQIPEEEKNLSGHGRLVRALGLSSANTHPDGVIQQGSTLGEACKAMDEKDKKKRFKPIFINVKYFNSRTMERMSAQEESFERHNELLQNAKTKRNRSAPDVALKHFQPERYREMKPKN